MLNSKYGLCEMYYVYGEFHSQVSQKSHYKGKLLLWYFANFFKYRHLWSFITDDAIIMQGLEILWLNMETYVNWSSRKKMSDYFSLQADIVLKHSQMKKILIL